MIKILNNEIEAELIEDYDYIEYKNSVKYIIELIKNNSLYHIANQQSLTLEFDDNLNIINDEVYEFKNNYDYIAYAPSLYKGDIRLCYRLIERFKSGWNNTLNEVEKYIIKELEFTTPRLSDEELTDKLMTYKNKYILYKKSAYIKLGLIHKVDIKESDAVIPHINFEE